jgi:UDP-glucose:(heptosyl)LPS alpha-1,3-glucosyltransferase
VTVPPTGGREGPPRSRRRVAVVIPKYGLIGGGERFAFELTERLSRDDRYEFHVFANRWVASSPRIAFHKVPSIRVPRSLRPWSFAWSVERMVARGGFDIVHAHERILRADIFSMHAVPHAWWVRHVRRKRLTLFDRVTIGLERRMMANAARSFFLPVSSLSAEAIRREYPIDPARIRVVPPGVDADRFSRPDRAACRAEVRSRHGIAESDLLVLFVGMNFEVKGLEAVIASVATARRARPDAGIHLLVVGRGDTRKYGNLARKHGITDAVTFAGAIAGGVERYYRAADVFAMLSAFDTFGMAVLEAMAAGLPVIVSANVGAKDLVEEETNGFVLTNGGNTDAVAGKIILLHDEARRAAMGEAGFRTASGDSWERTASEVARLYDEVADRRRLGG